MHNSVYSETNSWGFVLQIFGKGVINLKENLLVSDRNSIKDGFAIEK